jgi:hypothetical protein
MYNRQGRARSGYSTAQREDFMWLQTKLAVALVTVPLALGSPPLWAQGVGHYLAPRDQVVAIRAKHLFDSHSGNLLDNQVVLVHGERIAEVGSAIQIPSGATIIDLGSATVLPGMIDAHVHVNTGGVTLAQRALRALANAQIDLAAGFTTVLDMDSRGGFYTVDLRDAINAGNVQGPRMQVVGQSINPRATNYYPDTSARFYEGFTENKNVNSPWLARAAVREAKLHVTISRSTRRRISLAPCTCGARMRRSWTALRSPSRRFRRSSTRRTAWVSRWHVTPTEAKACTVASMRASMRPTI